ncbi:thioester reductase domain-containing protein [Flavobacterium oreochromis]|uniref:thioester reductase domain-containing protein n=1 Tax=Flavobacterium oreochromis TaxID=2906078 RepID=UPI00385AF6D1
MKEQTISSRLTTVCKKYKDKIAVKTDTAAISYSQLDTLSDQLAKNIFANTGQSNIVATLLAPSLEYILSITGINKSGNAFLPIDTAHPLNKIEEQLHFSKPSVILVSKEWTHLIENISEDILVLRIELDANTLHISKKVVGDWVELEKPTNEVLEIEMDKKSNSYVLYTSGSTGKPKAILGRNDSLCHFIEWQIDEFKLSEVKGALLTNLGFDVSLRDIFTPLLSGGELIIPSRSVREDIFYILDLIKTEKIELLHVVPSMLKVFAQQDAAYFASIKFVFTAGEALFWKDVYQWKEKINSTALITNLYGPSETTLAKFFYTITEPIEKNWEQIVPLGKPLPDTQVYIYANNQICKEGETGEIMISTDYRSNGYLFNDELNNEKFVTIKIEEKTVNVYATGDLGFLKNGYLHFAGRKDRQVKIYGNRVELLEVETVLAGIKEIEECAVLFIENADNQILIAFYTAKSGLQEETVTNYLKSFLPNYMIPHSIVYIHEIPLNTNGKKDYRKLLEIYNQKNHKSAVSTDSQTDLKNKVYAIIQKYAFVTTIKEDDTFMKLGVSSLKSIQILSNFYKEFKVKIPLVFILNNKIKDIVNFISDSLSTNTTVEVEDKKEDYSFLVSPNQRQMLIATMYSKESNLAYNVLLAFRIKGNLDEVKLTNYVNHLVQSNEIFRTTYTYSNNSFQQKILPKEGKYQVYEKIEINETNIEDYLKEELNTEFELFNDSLPLKISLLQVGQNDFVLVFKTHHVTVDIQALAQIKNDFMNYYHNGVMKTTNPTLEYIHFTQHYNHLLNSQVASKTKDFWKGKFMNKFNFELPSDFKRMNARDFGGKNVSLDLGESLSKKILAFNKENSVSLFMLYSSTLSLFFRNYSKSNEIIFGIPMTLRDMGETYNDTVGFFVNTLPVKFIIDENKQFKEYLQDRINDLLDYYENKFYPFSQIVEDINYRHELNRNPVFNYMVVGIESESYSKNEKDETDLEIEALESNDYTTKFDLTFMVIRHDDTISLKMEYDVSLYKEETAVFFLEQIKNAMAQAVENSNLSINDIKFDHREFAHSALRSEMPAVTVPAEVKTIIQTAMSSIETLLYLIWKKILEHGDIEITQDFFEVGGTSIKAISIITQINEEFKTKFTLVDFYLHPTIKEFAELLNTKGQSNKDYQLDLEKEAIFTKTYDFPTQEFVATKAPNILLTGATGYVGCYLIRELFNYDLGKLYCLVRCDSEKEGFVRLKQNLAGKGLWQDSYENRIVIVKGDISQPRLGIDSAIYEELSNDVNLVLHNATFMNHVLHYDVLKRANVNGMEEIFQFCLNKKKKKLHYVSTTSVFNMLTYNKEVIVDESSSIANEKHYNSLGYKASKWVAERLVEKAVEKFDIPIVTHRVGLVLWDSENKTHDGSNQWLKQYLESCAILGIYPDYDRVKYLTISVNVLVKNMCYFLNKDYISGIDKYTVLHHFTKQQSPKDLVIDYYGEDIDKLTCVDEEEWLNTARKEVLPISWRLPFFDIDQDDIVDLGDKVRIILNEKTLELLKREDIILQEN